MRLLTAVSLVRVQQGEFFIPGSMVKRLRHRPFTAVTGVQIPLESLRRHSQVVRQRSATPLSPVQIWLAPLGEIWKQMFPDFLVYKYNIPYIKMRYVKNVLPTSKNNRKYIENQLSGAIEQMEEYIRKYPMFLVMDYV